MRKYRMTDGHGQALTFDQLKLEADARRRLPDPERRRLLREQAGLSRERFGELLGVSAGAILHWERDDCLPLPKTLLAYVDALERFARLPLPRRQKPRKRWQSRSTELAVDAHARCLDCGWSAKGAETAQLARDHHREAVGRVDGHLVVAALVYGNAERLPFPRDPRAPVL